MPTYSIEVTLRDSGGHTLGTETRVLEGTSLSFAAQVYETIETTVKTVVTAWNKGHENMLDEVEKLRDEKTEVLGLVLEAKSSLVTFQDKVMNGPRNELFYLPSRLSTSSKTPRTAWTASSG